MYFFGVFRIFRVLWVVEIRMGSFRGFRDLGLVVVSRVFNGL